MIFTLYRQFYRHPRLKASQCLLPRPLSCFMFHLNNPAFYSFSFLHSLLKTTLQFWSLPSVSPPHYLIQRITLSPSPIPVALHYFATFRFPYTSPPLASLTQRLSTPIPNPSVCLCFYSYHCISPSLYLPSSPRNVSTTTV